MKAYLLKGSFVLSLFLIVIQSWANPILPGYFADGTIKKFGDAYYIYATTDGVMLASGEPSVWVSYDLKNWVDFEMEMSLPDGLTNCWAPDVVEGKDGNYYYYMGNCQSGCNIYGYMSSTPVGPWVPINDGDPVIPVGTGKTDLPALDAQFFMDDDGSLYAYFGTWITSFGGMGWVKINTDDMCTIEESGYIPLSQIPNAFEASYMMKKNNTYILMYSAGDCKLDSYAVHYAYSDSPTGPFTYGDNNPILESDGALVDGPGHHSVLEKDGEYYIIYHRHDNPHSTGGMFRQTCADKLVFTDDHTIAKVVPTEDGYNALGVSEIGPENLALGASAEASSYYHLITKGSQYTDYKAVDYEYEPLNATDDSNNTLWKAGDGSFPQSLTIDMGETKSFGRIMTEFEYPTYYYQYKIETSVDGDSWTEFADKTSNKTSGSPVIDDKSAEARYIKITITGVEKTGLFAAIWNVKVVENGFSLPDYEQMVSTDDPEAQPTGECLVDVDFGDYELGTVANAQVINEGTLGGSFLKSGTVQIKEIDGVKAAFFNGSSYLKSTKTMPESMGWNAPYTISAWVYNPSIASGECITSWTSRSDMLQASYAAMYFGSSSYGAAAHGDGAVDLAFGTRPSAGEWHHIALTFDGMLENVYVDGELNNQEQLMVFVKPTKISIGASGNSSENYNGYIATLSMYNKSISSDSISDLMQKTNPFLVHSAIQEESAYNLNIYPNPCKDILYVDGLNDDITGIQLINTEGKIVYNEMQTSYEKQIDVEAYPSGLYYLILDMDDGYIKKKILIDPVN